MSTGIPDSCRYAAPDRYELLKNFAHDLRRNPTDAEQFLWQQLKGKALGVKFMRQYVVGDYIADLICIERKLIIEVDGGYHCLPNQQEEDKIREAVISKMGFKILRFTNEEVLYNTSTTVKRISQIINQQR